jgi:hypothetical protein
VEEGLKWSGMEILLVASSKVNLNSLGVSYAAYGLIRRPCNIQRMNAKVMIAININGLNKIHVNGKGRR